MNEKMTPQQALGFLDNVAAKYMGTRQDHETLKESILVLKELIDRSAQEMRESN